MSQDRATNLFKEKKITAFQFDAYRLFEDSELGRVFLKKVSDSVLLEEPNHDHVGGYAFQDGRRSIWRDIKIAIDYVKWQLEGAKHERDNPSSVKPREFNWRNASPYGG